MTSKGFTLLELLISLTIVAMITVLVFGGLRVGIRAWEKGEQNVGKNQRERVSLDMMKRQLASLHIPKKPKDKGSVKAKQPFFLKGDSKRLTFLSTLAMIPGNDFGEVFVIYAIKSSENGEKLVFYESNKTLLLGKTNISDKDFYDLIPQAHDIGFGYLRGGADWVSSWDSEKDKGAPLAIRIVFEESSGSKPISVIARIEQEPEE